MDSDDGDDDDEHQAAVACGKDSAITHHTHPIHMQRSSNVYRTTDDGRVVHVLPTIISMRINGNREERVVSMEVNTQDISGIQKTNVYGFFALLYTLARRNHPLRRIRLSSV